MNTHAFAAEGRAAVYDAIASRRDIRAGFTMDPIEEATLARILAALTDASLHQQVTPLDRSLGEIAWHIATSIPEMANRTGLRVAGGDGRNSTQHIGQVWLHVKVTHVLPLPSNKARR